MAEYIEREATIARIKKYALDAYDIDLDDEKQFAGKSLVENYCEGLYEAIEWVDDIPAADVAPVVHGRWIEKSAPARKIYFECSHCGAQENKHTAIKGHYCWRCGAKMDGGDNDEAN